MLSLCAEHAAKQARILDGGALDEYVLHALRLRNEGYFET